MNRKNVVVFSLLMFLSFAISSCAQKPVLGLDEPIVVKEVDLLFFEVEIMESFKFGTHTFDPKAPYNMLIVIKASTEHSNPNSVCGWGEKVMLEFSRNGNTDEIEWGICGSNRVVNDKWVRFFFTTYKEGVSDYQIVFPDGQRVPIGRLID